MTHPIDPQTPEVLTARFLWDAAKEGDILRFLDTWERMIAGHYKEVENSYENGKEDAGSYDRGYDRGVEDGFDEGHDRGWAEAMAERDKNERPASTS